MLQSLKLNVKNLLEETIEHVESLIGPDLRQTLKQVFTNSAVCLNKMDVCFKKRREALDENYCLPVFFELTNLKQANINL